MMVAADRRMQVIMRATQFAMMSGPRRGLALDVFAAIRGTGVKLAFVPLKNLLGAYVPGTGPDGISGILISDRHPQALQRYTAAHELGHHILHKERFSLDRESDITASDAEAVERDAQLFAAYILMPPQYIGIARKRVGFLDGVTPTGEMIYAMAGLLGVSYKAMLVQLQTLTMISHRQFQQLWTVAPKQIKTRIGFGVAPDDANAQVWPNGVLEGPGAEISVGDIIAVALPENRTTGHRWFHRTDESFDDGLSINADRYVSAAQPSVDAVPGTVRVGQGGQRQILLRSVQPGPWRLSLGYARVQRPGQPIRTFELAGHAHPLPRDEWNTAYVDRFRDADTTPLEQ